MAWGDKEKWLLGMAEETGEMPGALLEKPELSEDLQSVVYAYRELRSDRQIGFGYIGPILFSSIDRFAARYGIDDPDEFDRLCFLIRAMDDEERSFKRPESDA